MATAVKTAVPSCGTIRPGTAASTGGLFNNYAVVQGVDEVVPVDVYVAGCPPRPEALLHGILMLYEQITFNVER